MLVRSTFLAQVRLKRLEGKLHVVLQDSRGAGSKSVPKASPSPEAPRKLNTLPVLGADTAQIARMEEAMAQVLDQHVSTRKVMRHLGYLERALQKQGAQCFVVLPLEVLRPALLQLKSVMGPAPSQGLTELHACLVVMVVEREMPQDSGDTGLLSVFNVDDKLLVSEISHADFMSADQAWSRQEETAS